MQRIKTHSLVDELGENPVEEKQKSSANRAFSPYLRRPIRSLDEVQHDDRHSDMEAREQAQERLDNNAFRMSNGR
jgi:hypothetical protein